MNQPPFPLPGFEPGGALAEGAPLIIHARKPCATSAPLPEVVGTGALYRGMMEEVRKVAPWSMSVVLTGETGTGKGTIAKAIHDLSPRARQPFVQLNCANVGADLVESELFGHERGAFTGAVAQKKGLMEQADGGTLFLDEIGEMPPAMQAKLLLALESKSFRRVGGDRQISVDVRIISATNRDLEKLVGDGTFRQDLRARLGPVRLHLPTLRERAEDVPALLAHYLSFFAPQFDRAGPYTVEHAALVVLAGCAWPDNVRQLRTVAERLAFDAMDTGLITAADAFRVAHTLGARPKAKESSAVLAPLAPDDSPATVSLPAYVIGEAIELWEARTLLFLYNQLLALTGHHDRAAESLGLTQRALYKRIRRARALVAEGAAQ